LSKESLALSRSLKDRRNIAISLSILADVARGKDNALRRRELLEEALALNKELGEETVLPTRTLN
jgi:hypothetical protein